MAIFLLLASLPFLFHSSFGSPAQAPSPAGSHHVEYHYHAESQKGPQKWGELNENWKACSVGKLQSPINLQRPKISRNLGDLQNAYKPANATIKSRGHDVTMTWTGDAGSMNINGTTYTLKTCHWHMPSEHRLNGGRKDLEIHLVHYGPSGQPEAAVGILYKVGKPDPFLAKLLSSIKSATKEEKSVGIIDPNDIRFSSRSYYRYVGSLTVPPCTEGIIWTIFQQVKTASREQLEALKTAVDEGFEMNSRPIRNLDGRTLYLYV